MRCHPIGDVTAAAANIQQPLGRSASDLLFHPVQIRAGGVDGALHIGIGPLAKLPRDVRLLTRLLHLLAGSHDLHLFTSTDRKSVVSGKSVSVRVDLGGCRFIKKKKNTAST